MRTVVLAPRKEDHGQRDLIWKYVRQWIEQQHPFYEIFEGRDDDSEKFSPARARNDAARQAGDDWDVAVIVDSDTIAEPTAVGDAVVRAALSTRLWIAGDVYMNMDEKSSRRILNGGLWFPRPDGHLPKNGANESIYGEPVSGVMTCSRELWELTGGYVECLEGWGFEDNIFFTCCQIFGDGAGWVPDSILFHLYHEKARRTDDTMHNYQIWKCLDTLARCENKVEAATAYLSKLGHTWPSAIPE